MINKLSLSSIFGIIVTTIGALLALLLIEMIDEIHSDYYKKDELIILTCIFAVMSLFLITGIGLMLKMKWARILALFILYFSVIILTIIMIFTIYTKGLPRLEEVIVIAGMSMFAYTFLICSIILLNHQIVKKEFDI